MSLDMLVLGGQVRDMARLLANDANSLAERLQAARDLLVTQSDDWEFWRDAVEEGRPRQAWLLAKPLEPMGATYDLPPCPPVYAAAASDGSQVDIDRHGISDCWLINIGTVSLTYGPDASFQAYSRPTLGYRDEDLTIQDRRGDREYTVTGPVLAAHRDLYEGLGLAEIALTLPSDIPRVALQDGTLIRWTLQGFEPWLQNHFLGDYLGFLETMRALPCPIGSYLSRPRSPELTGLVRFLHVQGDWDKWKQRYPRRSDSPFRDVTDHLLVGEMLEDGQRGPRYQSMSKINVDEYPEPHTIQFFYMKVGREVARVEFPAWVADRDLDLLHAVVYDQCRRGQNYPVALQRAHEQAVIHGGDRRQVEALVERLFAAESVTTSRSAKSNSKLRPRL